MKEQEKQEDAGQAGPAAGMPPKAQQRRGSGAGNPNVPQGMHTWLAQGFLLLLS